ncbi:MAG: ankyrin repeat domain-containing protein [Bryobacteraceae bacterium]|nr:ankyrin repeat domain-containing protein [Bryobacteraceae bacterium]
MRLTILPLWGALALAQSTPRVDFEKEVQPILAEKCHSCHGAEVQQSGLRLDKRQNALRGGDYGPVIVPGKSAESKLIKRLVNGDGGLQMPPSGALSDEEIAKLRTWIDQGADFRITVTDEAPAAPVDPQLAAFIAATRASNLTVMRQMIAAQPKLVSARDSAQSTALHHAAGFGTLAAVKLLLESGAEVNATNQRRSTALHWALPDEAKVRLLVAHGAKLNALTSDGRSLVYQAASMANATPLLRYLLEQGVAADGKTANGGTPLMVAARRADLSAMRALLEKNANVNAKNAAGGTALMAAAATGNPAAVRLLLEKGAAVNERTKRNETALADAATAGNEETVKLLLDAGAEVNVRDVRGYSPLLYAAASDTMPTGVVKMLLAKGADVEAKGDGETARQLAAKRGDSEVARLLGVPAEERRRLGVAALPEGSGQARAIPMAVTPALGLLEKQSHNFIRIGGCNACHAQDLPSAAAAVARDRGIPAPRTIPQLSAQMQGSSAERLMDLNSFGVASLGWELFDFGMNRIPRDAYTDAVVRFVQVSQSAEGHWVALESRRPPMNSGSFQSTALAVYMLKHYGRPEESAANAARIARAAAWLEGNRASQTQDMAFRLLGLAWSGGNVAPAAKDLAAAQRADGGWSQLATMGSDAYATGEALYALNAAGGLPVTGAVYQKGVKYLLRTQAPDGSWHVASRSIWVQPYFESGFPYGHNQWISAAGTSWAAMALSLAVEPRRLSLVR